MKKLVAITVAAVLLAMPNAVFAQAKMKDDKGMMKDDKGMMKEEKMMKDDKGKMKDDKGKDKMMKDDMMKK